jgi:DNA-binding LacI/PurR family transcriptional regulator
LNGLSVILGKWPDCDASQRLRQADTLSEQYIALPVCGVILEPMAATDDALKWNSRIIQNFARARIPVVLLEREIFDYPQRSPFDMVGIDDRHAGYVITKHLLSLGRRRIAFLSQCARTPALGARVCGWKDALAAHGIEAGPDLLHLEQPIGPDSIRRLSRRRPPDAFVCSSDFEAAALLQVLTALDYRVPQDVAIVGFNDDPCSRLLPVSLTTMRPPWAEVGRSALAALMDRLENPSAPPRQVRLACELIVRDSCGAASRHPLTGDQQ